MTSRLAVTLTAAIMAGIATAGQAPAPHPPARQPGLVIPMHDGATLAADVYFPAAGGRWSAILIRTPYDRRGYARSSAYYVRRGYAVLVESVRGRYGSLGRFGFAEEEGPDGNDTINWIAAQPWSDGRVVMAGSSYPGITQWWAALEDNPHLFAISPGASGDDEYVDRFYSPGGAFKLGHRLLWVSQNLTPAGHMRPALNDYIRHLPLRTADLVATGEEIQLWRDALAHPSYDKFWSEKSVREDIPRIHTPVLSFGGWFDNYAESDLDAFSRLSRSGVPIETWIGPWAHNPGYRFPTRNFGPNANLNIRERQLEWFDRWLETRRRHETSPHKAVLHLFVMGPDVWRDEFEWPLARTKYTRLFLASRGRANGRGGNGSLQPAQAGRSTPDMFTYDPNNPVPTTGGAICCDPRLLPPGPLEQSAVENRPDVLVYTSKPLAASLEVTGAVRVVLYAATSANDTDFTAKLVDVDPGNRALLVTDGIQRLRYRLSLDKPVFVKRNVPYQVNIDAGVTSYVFARGHRIRLEISSSNFPRYDRNLNSTRPNADEVKLNKARQTVFHNSAFPSSLVLPTIDNSSNPERQRSPRLQ